jgi:predicted nicotinamide N-methyase
MSFPLQLQTFSIAGVQWQLYVPDPKYIKDNYLQIRERDPHTPFPYWSKVWASAIALGTFLIEQPQYIEGKQVLELAAGLGLPSIISASKADHVIVSDYLPEAVKVIEQSVHLHQFTNVTCLLVNWHQIPENIHPDVLLLSDINYEPEEFVALYKIILSYLQSNTTIIISTPQRLMAKSFIEKLAPFAVLNKEIAILENEVTTNIQILVLKGSKNY